jgi:hypothetical protein
MVGTAGTGRDVNPAFQGLEPARPRIDASREAGAARLARPASAAIALDPALGAAYNDLTVALERSEVVRRLAQREAEPLAGAAPDR